MAKCEEKCEVYSRVCGYFRPVANWNHGKREEFKDRKNFNVKAGVVCALFALSLLTGCMVGGGTTTVKEFDAEGKLTKETVSKKPFVNYITDSTKDKTLVVWTSGWVGELSVALMTSEDPTPHVKIYAGKLDKGIISAKPDTKDWNGIASAILATKQDVNVSLSGISGTSSGSKAAEKSAIDPATAPSVSIGGSVPVDVKKTEAEKPTAP